MKAKMWQAVKEKYLEDQFMFYMIYNNPKNILNRKTFNYFIGKNTFISFINLALEFEEFRQKLNSKKIILAFANVFYDSISLKKSSYDFASAQVVHDKLFSLIEVLEYNDIKKYDILAELQHDIFDEDNYFSKNDLLNDNKFDLWLLQSLVCDNDFLEFIDQIISTTVLTPKLKEKIKSILEVSLDISYRDINYSNFINLIGEEKISNYDVLKAQKLLNFLSTTNKYLLK